MPVKHEDDRQFDQLGARLSRPEPKFASLPAHVREMANRAVESARMPLSEGRKLIARQQSEKGPKAAFLRQLAIAGISEPVREHVFAKPRRWRFDYCWPEMMIAVEYQGIFGARNTSHASVGNLKRDYRKFTEASLRGWLLILIDADSVQTGDALAWVERAVRLRVEVMSR
jgi:hypothetical protein